MKYYSEKYNLDCHALFPNAINAYKKGLALPLYSGLSIKEVKTIISQLTRILDCEI
jgi:dTDP-4-amino-4,6-dideoxygalactose transaminase